MKLQKFAEIMGALDQRLVEAGQTELSKKVFALSCSIGNKKLAWTLRDDDPNKDKNDLMGYLNKTLVMQRQRPPTEFTIGVSDRIRSLLGALAKVTSVTADSFTNVIWPVGKEIERILSDAALPENMIVNTSQIPSSLLRDALSCVTDIKTTLEAEFKPAEDKAGVWSAPKPTAAGPGKPDTFQTATLPNRRAAIDKRMAVLQNKMEDLDESGLTKQVDPIFDAITSNRTLSAFVRVTAKIDAGKGDLYAPADLETLYAKAEAALGTYEAEVAKIESSM